MNHYAILEEIRHEVLPLLGEGKVIGPPNFSNWRLTVS